MQLNKTNYFMGLHQKHHLLVIFRVNSWFRRIKIMKNEANLNSQKFTATPYNIGGYNDFHPKTQNGTKPNEANLKPISEMENPRPSKNKKMENEPNFDNQIQPQTLALK